MARYLGGLSAYPWQALAWFGHGHTVPCGLWGDGALGWALLTREHPSIGASIDEQILGDPVNLLWLLPISEAERDVATAEGAAALLEALPAERWKKA